MWHYSLLVYCCDLLMLRRMFMSNATFWNRRLLNLIRTKTSFLNRKIVTFPEELDFPLGPKGNAFELGGQDGTNGLAVIVASPSGKPSSGRILYKRWPNEFHAAINVWPGCIIAIGGHSRGVAHFGYYKVLDCVVSTKEKDLPIAKLQLLTAADSTHICEPEKVFAYDKISTVLREKLFSYNCTTPMYVEWFQDFPAWLKVNMCKQMFDYCDDINQGLDSSNLSSEAICEEFKYFAESIQNRCISLHREYPDSIVWILTGFKLITDPNNDNGNGDLNFLRSEARIFMSSENDPTKITEADELYFVYTAQKDIAMKSMQIFAADYNHSYVALWCGGGIGGLVRTLVSTDNDIICHAMLSGYSKPRFTYKPNQQSALSDPTIELDNTPLTEEIPPIVGDADMIVEVESNTDKVDII